MDAQWVGAGQRQLGVGSVVLVVPGAEQGEYFWSAAGGSVNARTRDGVHENLCERGRAALGQRPAWACALSVP